MKHERKPSLDQLSWTIKQAAALSGDSEKYIRKMVATGDLSEKSGELVMCKIGGCQRYHIKLTRAGMTKLTGYQFPKLNIIEYTKEVLRQVL